MSSLCLIRCLNPTSVSKAGEGSKRRQRRLFLPQKKSIDNIFGKAEEYKIPSLMQAALLPQQKHPACFFPERILMRYTSLE